MCGIGGIVTGRPQAGWASVCADMLRQLRHRGPDDRGWLAFGPHGTQTGRDRPDDFPAEVLLVHRRLSILDLSAAGHQPMSTPDGRYHIVYNGEIYNYRELRDELTHEGFTFQSQSDTEVLLVALAHWGVDVLPRLVGMFAFALLDTQERTLLLARDFFGIKPLYYTLLPDGLAFASEIRALLEVPGVSRRVHPPALLSYLESGWTDHGAETMIAGIRHLLPAHFLLFRLGEHATAAPQRYWQLDTQRRLDISFSESARTMRELFLENVAMHLRSDVPVGTALSGGVDSSAIVMAVREVVSDADFHSFSYVADDPVLNEERWVDMAAAASGVKVHKVRIDPEELVADLENLIAVHGEPFGGTSIYAQYRVFRLAREMGVKVLLDGQGADELLAGYPVYRASRLASLLRGGHWLRAWQFVHGSSRYRYFRRGTVLRLAASQLLPNALQRPLKWFGSQDRTPPWLNGDWFAAQEAHVHPRTTPTEPRTLRSDLLNSFFSVSLPMLLRYEDRDSMAFSVESRVPFLTPRLVEFVFSLPEEYIIGTDGTNKYVFREAMRGIVPDAILDRRDKIGFATPERTWLQASRPWVERVIHSDAAQAIPALHHDVLADLCQAVLSGEHGFSLHLWRWLNLICWSEQLGITYDQGPEPALVPDRHLAMPKVDVVGGRMLG